jgi:ankyrin repeat protein
MNKAKKKSRPSRPVKAATRVSASKAPKHRGKLNGTADAAELEEFHKAVKNGDCAKVTAMLDRNPALSNSVNSFGIPALMTATAWGHQEIRATLTLSNLSLPTA